jgi:hypothetical protein
VPILDIQRRLTQVGVIRLGHKVPTGNTDRNGKPIMRPTKLSKFRVTSPNQETIEAIAAAYGGTAQPWQGNSGPEWEVFTDRDRLPVLVPPQRIDPNYELWGRNFQARVCDGGTERMRNAPCLCLQGSGGHVHDFEPAGECECGAKRECKPTTRLSLMLSEIPGIGTFKLESHGRNVAAEMPMTSDALERATRPVPALLVVQPMERNRLVNAGKANEKIEPRKFFVPKLVFNWLTPQEAFSGQIGAAAHRALTGAAPERVAIAAAPKVTIGEIRAEVTAATDITQVQMLWRQAATEGLLDDDLKVLLTARADALKPPADAPAPVAEPVEAEVVGDADAVWSQIMSAAGAKGISKLDDVVGAYERTMGHHPDDPAATAQTMQVFLAKLKAGEVK